MSSQSRSFCRRHSNSKLSMLPYLHYCLLNLDSIKVRTNSPRYPSARLDFSYLETLSLYTRAWLIEDHNNQIHLIATAQNTHPHVPYIRQRSQPHNVLICRFDCLNQDTFIWDLHFWRHSNIKAFCNDHKLLCEKNAPSPRTVYIIVGTLAFFVFLVEFMNYNWLLLTSLLPYWGILQPTVMLPSSRQL